MAPQKYASVRYKSRPVTLVPFRDDSSLFALRYDHTIQAEPPIPIPARSPLRLRSAASRPVSCIPAPGSVVISPPPRPPPPAEQHPALRTITTARTGVDVHDPTRDSGHAPTTSSRSYSSYTFYEESEDEDPFPYEKIDATISKARVSPELLVPPLRIRAPYPTPFQSEHDEIRNLSGANNSSSDSIPLPSPELSDDDTVSPTSPTTPPPSFPSEKPTSLFSRSFAFKSSGSSMKSSRSNRLRKKSHPQPGLENDAIPAKPPKEAKTSPIASTPPVDPPLAVAHNSAPPGNGDVQRPRGRSSSLDSPKLTTTSTTTTGTQTQGDDFFDFVNQISFSKRGSIMLAGKRPSEQYNYVTMSDHDMANNEPTRERAFPLVSSLIPSPQVDGPALSITVEDNELGSITPSRPALASAVAEAPSSPTSPQYPSIRVISVDMERESQKVRSLYDSVEDLRWEDGGRRLSSFGERLEPTVEVPSDVDENDASNRGHGQGQSPSESKSDRLGTPTRATGIPGSAAHTVSPQDDLLRHATELAGGIEDWEDVNGEDVDRYGFIIPRRPVTPSDPPTDPDTSGQYSPRKTRNVLVRKDAHARFGLLGMKRGPGRKVSERSLHTQASEMSATSRNSTHSALRQALNLLPHNKDWRWMDEAGAMLAQQPGLTSIGEDTSAGQLAEDYKHKEWERTEKWRKMAKIIKPGKDGEGMVFEFDTKHPKLLERTWKGIPDRWRAAAWYSFLSTSARSSKKPLADDEELMARFHMLQEHPSPDDVQIDLDVPRTISQHIMFRKRYRGGQRLLFRVLHALSLYFPETGYVQGMASLAATLLSYYDEEKCFVMLVRLWDLRGLKRLYQPQFAELMQALSDFEKYWLGKRPVAKSLQELCIDPTAYGTRWYLTLFNLSIPFSSQLRVWDVFMLLGGSPPDPSEPATANSASEISPRSMSSQGLEILHATSTALMLALGEHIVDSEFENAMRALTSFIPIRNDELLMKVVHSEYKQHMSKMKKA